MRRANVRIRRQSRTLVLAAVAFVAFLGFSASARAAGPQVTVLYPVSGTLTSSPLESPPHHHFWGNFAVDAAAGAGTPVYARFGNASGQLSLTLGGTFEPCAAAGTGGSGVIVNVFIDGQQIGRVHYAHLSGISRSSGAINNGDQIGVLYSGSNTGCWQGSHTHVEPRGLAGSGCFVSRGLGSGVNGGVALGVIGGGYTAGDNQTCPAGADTATSTPAGDGSLVRVPTGEVFRIAGGAPLHISRCNYTNNCAGLTAVNDLSRFAALRATARSSATSTAVASS